VTSDHGKRPDHLSRLDMLADGHIGIDR